MGVGKEEEPMLGKEGVGPALMICPPSPAATSTTFPEDAAQPHANPGIETGERDTLAVLEIGKPAGKDSVEVRNDHGEAMTVTAFRLGTNGLLELLQTLGPRPAHPLFKMVSQKVETTGKPCIDDAGFEGV